MKKHIILSAFLVMLFPLSLNIFAQFVEKPIKLISYDENKVVYVMPSSNIYHQADCKLLIGGRTGMSRKHAEENGNKPCTVCFVENIRPGYRWGFSLLKPTQSELLAYSDNNIEILFIVLESQVGFEIQNNTDSGIKLNWDDISFISPEGQSSRIIHSGIRFIDRNNPQAPTTIPPGSKFSDIIIPSVNITFTNNEWNNGRLFPGDRLAYNGKEFGIYFPLEIKGTKKEYSFRFKIGVTREMPASDLKQ